MRLALGHANEHLFSQQQTVVFFFAWMTAYCTAALSIRPTLGNGRLDLLPALGGFDTCAAPTKVGC